MNKWRNFKIEIFYDARDDVWFAKFPELKGCMNHGDTPEEALKNLQDIKEEWLKIGEEAGWDMTQFKQTPTVSSINVGEDSGNTTTIVDNKNITLT